MKESQIVLFDDVLSSFLEDKRTRSRYSTYIGYECVIRNHIMPFFSGRDIRSIKPLTVREWQNELISLGLSPMYVRRVDTCLVSVFNWACRFWELPSNPATLAGSIGTSFSHRIDFWTLAEFRRFIGGVADPRVRLAFELLYWTGMRVGELLALTPADVNSRRCELTISKSYRRYHKSDLITKPKTRKSERTVTLNTSLMRELSSFLRSDRSLKPNSRIFPFTSNRLFYRMKVTCRVTGVKKIRIHDLRHSHASLLIEMNVTPLLICERLGHEKVETTLNIYSHLYPNKQKQLSDKLEDLFTGEAKDTRKNRF
ncbi:MAG: site-specific integrase [Lachnospiraceae bacterium]|nr:site-specific integrase [Lachnospiraceae bacterium]MBR5369287.1 site-specific integrase [Lachnospiraceae bacterium]